jgi:dUTPase
MALQVYLNPDHPNARLPTKARYCPLNTGTYNIYSSEDIIIPSEKFIKVRFPCSSVKRLANGHYLKVETGIHIAIPKGLYGSLERNYDGFHLLQVGNGIVTNNDRSLLTLLLYTHQSADYTVHAGDPVARLILKEIRGDVPVQQVPSLEAFDSPE